MDKSLVKTSKFLSLILRHDPGAIGLSLDAEGWASVEELLRLAKRAGKRIDEATLRRVVEENDKQRFAISHDGQRIRANQGHSFDVELGLSPVVPDNLLYHGTVARFIDAIREQGLLPGSRQHVHLSADVATAMKVGERRGRPIVLTVRAEAMHSDGHVFYRSENGVWLTEHVPASYIDFGAA